MKNFVLIVLSFLFLHSASAVYAQENAAPQNNDAEQTQSINLSIELMNAVERKDRAAIERLAAEDFYVTSPGDLTQAQKSRLDRQLHFDELGKSRIS